MALCCGSTITIYEDDIDFAVSQGIVSKVQGTALWNVLESRSDQRYKMDWVNLAYFFGGMLILGSMTWLTNQAWLDAKGLSLFFLSLLYTGVFGYGGYYVWNKNLPAQIPQIVGGIFIIVSVFIAPVSTWALQRYFNYWLDKTPDLFEYITLFVAGSVAIKFVNFPLLTLPISLALCGFAEQDLAPLIFQKPTNEDYAWISVVYGIFMIAVSVALDKYEQIKQSQQDYAFWTYIYGVAAFSVGFSALRYNVYVDNTAFKWIYLLVNLAMCGGTVILQRNVFLVFGGLGSSSAVVDFLVTEATLTENAWISVSFGLVLTLLGLYNQKTNATSDFPFWAYLFGSTIFFGGMSALSEDVYPNLIFKFIYFLVSVGLCLFSLYTQYKVFLFYGIIGGLWYIEQIVYVYFWNSWWLPFILTGIGLAIIALAIYLSRGFMKKRLALKAEEQRQQQQEVELQMAFANAPAEEPYYVWYYS